MARNEQVRRQWNVWRALSAARAPVAAEEIAQRLHGLQVSARTVRRDLEALRDLGVPVRTVRQGRSVRYCVTDDGPSLRMDLDALLALRLASGLLAPFARTAVGEALDHLDRRLQAMVPRHWVGEAATLANGVSVQRPGEPCYALHEEVLRALREALAQRRVVRVTYAGLDGPPRERLLHPQHLAYGPRGLYLLALDETREGRLRTFRVERIREASALARQARRDPTFDPEAHFAGTTGVHSAEHAPVRVLVRLHARAAVRQVRENPWHGSQRLDPLPGGGATLSLHLATTRELVAKVLALGPDAEVLEPAPLRAEVRSLLAQARARYQRLPGARIRSPSVRHRE